MGLLSWALVALGISLGAGILGYSGVAQGAAQVAKVLFGVFLAIASLLFVLTVLGVEAIV